MLKTADHKQRGKASVWLIFVAALSAGIGLWTAQLLLKPELDVQFTELKVFPQPRTLKPMVLQGAGGNISLQDFKGKWVVVFFGYTHCPDVCPTALSTLADAFSRVADDQKPEVLFVSVDPKRDTPDKLTEYVKFFNPNFHAATAEDSILKQLTKQFSAIFYLAEPDQNGAYDVDHTASMFVVNPKGQLFGVFSAPQKAKKLAKDFELLAGIKNQ